jgi:hypothetical protein
MTSQTDESLLLFTAEKIEEKTGKSWDAWFEILDRIDATTLNHTEIARYLYEHFLLDGWYSQGITVSYERVRGLRPKHGDRDGTFAASASKTVPVSIDILFDAWIQADQREAWLGKDVLSLRSNSHLKSARFDIQESGAILAVYFTDKGPGKSMVAIEEPRLSSQDAVVERKAIWKERFGKLAAYLAS